MKSYVDIWEDAMTTASAGLGTGTEITDDDMRTLSGKPPMKKRPALEEKDKEEELIDLEGDEVADAQSKTQSVKGTAGDSGDPSGP